MELTLRATDVGARRPVCWLVGSQRCARPGAAGGGTSTVARGVTARPLPLT
jgi:hypothetical protein